MRLMELMKQIDLTELFEPEDNGKDTINWNKTKQIGGKQVRVVATVSTGSCESFASCVHFSGFDGLVG